MTPPGEPIMRGAARSRFQAICLKGRSNRFAIGRI
jgi:hypothetical protein